MHSRCQRNKSHFERYVRLDRWMLDPFVSATVFCLHWYAKSVYQKIAFRKTTMHADLEQLSKASVPIPLNDRNTVCDIYIYIYICVLAVARHKEKRSVCRLL